VTGGRDGGHAAIWRVVRRIPRGRVATYGQVAALAGRPGQARQVGYALHALPPETTVPWHRVINARGEVSLPDEAGGALQRALLAHEGVEPGASGSIPLARYRWSPRGGRVRRW